MGINIAFLLFNIGVAVGLEEGTWVESWDKKLSIILQLSQLTEAWEILTSTEGMQTPGFVQGKKVDAIFRSVPSVVLQMYGLLVTLDSLGTTGIFTITLSIVSGITGAAITLGTIAPKSGQGLFSLAFAIHFCYYVCELAVRLISMSLLFVSIGPIAFAVLVADFLSRYLIVQGRDGNPLLSFSFDTFMKALLQWGSDAIDGPTSNSVLLWSSITSATLFISLCLFNLYATPSLIGLRAAYGGQVVTGLTALACVALLFKYLLGLLIWKTSFWISRRAPKKEKQMWIDVKEKEEQTWTVVEERDESCFVPVGIC